MSRRMDELPRGPGETVFSRIHGPRYTRTFESAMHRYTCPRCRREGLVRAETVIKGGTTTLDFYCGACEYAWTQGPPTPTPSRDSRDA